MNITLRITVFTMCLTYPVLVISGAVTFPVGYLDYSIFAAGAIAGLTTLALD